MQFYLSKLRKLNNFGKNVNFRTEQDKKLRVLKNYLRNLYISSKILGGGGLWHPPPPLNELEEGIGPPYPPPTLRANRICYENRLENLCKRAFITSNVFEKFNFKLAVLK